MLRVVVGGWLEEEGSCFYFLDVDSGGGIGRVGAGQEGYGYIALFGRHGFDILSRRCRSQGVVVMHGSLSTLF